MNNKHYAQVLIDGKIYTLGGSEEEFYLQKVAGYINEKTAELRKQEGFNKQSQDYQSVMVQLNIADDYFKAREQIKSLQKEKSDTEKEIYSLKRELITVKMKLDAINSEKQED